MIFEQLQPEADDPYTMHANIEETLPARAPSYGGLNNNSLANFSRRDRPPSYQSYPNAAAGPLEYLSSSATPFPNATSGSDPSRSAGQITVSRSTTRFPRTAKIS